MTGQQTRRNYLRALGVTSVLGLSGCSQVIDSREQTSVTDAPTSNLGGANFTFEYAEDSQQVTIRFNGGADIIAGDLQVRSSTGIQTGWAQLGSTITGPDERISAGSTAVLGEDILNWGQSVSLSETIRVVHVGRGSPATLGRFTPPENSTLTSTVPPTETATDTPTPAPTDTPTPEPDTTAPSISAFSISNPSGQELRTSFESTEQLAAIQVSISGAEPAILTTGDFVETSPNGTYTYEATYEASSDGEYTATLEQAADSSGNDGATDTSVTVSVQSSRDGIVAQDQLISRWPFEEDLADTVGDNDASAAIGEPEFDSYAGRSAVRFDGDLGVMINEGENPELSLMAAENAGSSFGGWIYFDAETGGHPNGDNTRHHILRNDAEYNFTAVPTDNVDSFQFQFSSDGYNTRETTDGEMTVPSEEWHHFFYVLVPESSIRFYLDGELVFEDTTISASAPTETAYWSHETIGSWYGTGNPTWYNLFVGKMADLRIYDTELSGDEVTQIYQNGSDSESGSSNSHTAQHGLAYHDDHVFVESDGEIQQIELSSDDVVNSFATPRNSRPTGLAYGDGSLWFADGIDGDYDGEILELDPETGETRSTIASSWDPRGLAFGDGSLWAVDITANRIVEYSTEGTELSSFDTPGVTWGQGLAYANGSIWLGNNCSGSGCTVSLREYDTDGNLLQQVERRSSDSTTPYGGLAATNTELLGPDTVGNVSVLRRIE
ncbi:putative secreted glycoprotein [Haloferax gibbonsii]|uniref:Secreted glycoprotein n=1 Tax=Haloferax gibbonsii TaxID=35746 RepID=A0A871BI48_HALGI|nr:LamG-like jellyroll fold domain-containing protein [Haloferax gibbonsii]QOS12718.1 putative secreted glycoprotein [Haloferax gibbonsii]